MTEPSLKRDKLIYSAGNVHDLYKIQDVVGEGAFGSVLRASRKSEGGSPQSRARAIKMVGNDSEALDVVLTEVDILAEISHPNIVKLYEAFQDATNTYLVMELCEGGDLFGAILAAKVFTEKQAAHVIGQIFQCIRYLHEKMIAHRDVKGENFLVQREGPIESSIIKLVDFGTARHFSPGETMDTALGTAIYMAPEVTLTRYGPACDLWSCGVLLYILLCGHAPFQGTNDSETIKLARKADLQFRKDYWESVSKEAVDMVKRLMQRKPKKRCTAAEALEHAWLQQRKSGEMTSTKSIDQSRLQQRLGAFCAHTKFKKMALEVVARNISEADIGELRDVFISIDTDKTGFVSKEELRRALSACGNDNLDALLSQLDADGDGCIDYREFLVATMDKKYYRQEEVLRDAFHVFDSQKTGEITMADIQRVLSSGGVRHSVPEEEVADMLEEIGKDMTGSISFEEFKVVVGGFDGSAAVSRKPSKKNTLTRTSTVEWKPILEDLAAAWESEISVKGLLSVKSVKSQERSVWSVKTAVWVEEPDGTIRRKSKSRPGSKERGVVSAVGEVEEVHIYADHGVDAIKVSMKG